MILTDGLHGTAMHMAFNTLLMLGDSPTKRQARNTHVSVGFFLVGWKQRTEFVKLTDFKKRMASECSE